jgi:hypothetical protein
MEQEQLYVVSAGRLIALLPLTLSSHLIPSTCPFSFTLSSKTQQFKTQLFTVGWTDGKVAHVSLEFLIKLSSGAAELSES